MNLVPQCQIFSSWPYDDALQFMLLSWSLVKKQTAAVIIGCGSHKETVITLGRNSDMQGPIHASPHVIVRRLERGGGVTAHEPGQLVLYPIFDCDHYKLTVPTIIDILEQTMLDFLQELGLAGHRNEQSPGVFVHHKKIGFVGLRIKERIIQHGIALNVQNDAAIFESFVPCGIKGLLVTSVCQHTDVPLPIAHYAQRLVYFFLRNWCGRTMMGTNFDVGVLLSNATDSSGTNSFASGK